LGVCQLIPDLSRAIIVTTPQDVAVLDSRKSVLFAKELKVPIVGVIENMSGFMCSHCRKEIDLFVAGGGERAAADLKVPFLGRIPLEPEMVKSGDSEKPFLSATKVSPAATAMDNIVNKIKDFLSRNEP